MSTKSKASADAVLFRAHRPCPAIGFAISAVLHGVASILLLRAPAFLAIVLCAIVAAGIVFQPEPSGEDVR